MSLAVRSAVWIYARFTIQILPVYQRSIQNSLSIALSRMVVDGRGIFLRRLDDCFSSFKQVGRQGASTNACLEGIIAELLYS
jgi:hypothetical protein